MLPLVFNIHAPSPLSRVVDGDLKRCFEQKTVNIPVPCNGNRLLAPVAPGGRANRKAQLVLVYNAVRMTVARIDVSTGISRNLDSLEADGVPILIREELRLCGDLNGTGKLGLFENTVRAHRPLNVIAAAVLADDAVIRGRSGTTA